MVHHAIGTRQRLLCLRDAEAGGTQQEAGGSKQGQQAVGNTQKTEGIEIYQPKRNP